MTDMTVVTGRARARIGASPEFTEICKAMYGPDVDAGQVWDDVLKLAPDQADLNAHKPSRTKRVLEGVALGSTVAGGILGVKEGHHALKAIRTARRAGQRIPGHAYRGLGLAGAATLGDAITTGVLAAQNKASSGKPKKLQPTGTVAKFIVPSKLPKMGAIATGLRTSWKGMGAKPTTQAAQPTGPMLGPRTRSQTRNVNIGRDVGTMLGTKSGKAVVGAAAATGAVKAAGAARQRRSNVDYVPDQYAYGKADTAEVEFSGTFSKFDDAKHLAFGWASVVKINGSAVVDKQDDYIDLGDLEDAAYDYVRGSRVGGNMHQRDVDDRVHKVSDMVESMVFTPEKIEKMGLPDDFPHGWWVGYKIHDPGTWDEVRSGRKTGFSIHGRGIRKAADIDEIMGYR